MFQDRVEAGRLLAGLLQDFRGRDVVVLGLPRGGVPVAAEVARAIEAPMDVIVIRKLGVPFEPEVAMGAVGEGGVEVVDRELVRRARVGAGAFAEVEARERAVVEARAAELRRGRPPLDLSGRVAMIVDDGIATGATARAACGVARAQGAHRVVVATPVAPASMTADSLGADDLVCVERPPWFRAVGLHYRDFAAVSDHEVAELLAAAHRPAVTRDAQVPLEDATLSATVSVPDRPLGVVLVAHGSGSSRHSPRNRYVADVLVRAGLATVLLDLLTPAEEGSRSLVFDVPMLASRLTAATAWTRHEPDLTGPVAFFGASTGAAAALLAAADLDGLVRAVVSRGGRPDLALDALPRVTAPTLLIVGGADDVVLRLNRTALARLRCERDLVVVPGATHLFEEPGALERVAAEARDWLRRHLDEDAPGLGAAR